MWSSSSGLTHFPVMSANQLPVCLPVTAAGREDVTPTMGVSFTLRLSVHFCEACFLIRPPSHLLRGQWVADSKVSFGLIFNYAFEAVPWGGHWLVRGRCRLFVSPGRRGCSYHLHGGRKRSCQTSRACMYAVMKVMWRLNGESISWERGENKQAHMTRIKHHTKPGPSSEPSSALLVMTERLLVVMQQGVVCCQTGRNELLEKKKV